MSRFIAAGSVVTPERMLSPGWVEVEAERIVGTGEGMPPSPAEQLTGMLVPGFVDIHTHGAGGVDYGDAARGPISAALDRQLQRGTTTVIASLATASLESLGRQVEALTTLIDGTGVLRGIHLEGPWLSPGHRGAHNADLLRAPDPDEVSAVLSASDAIRMVTIAPELPGSIDAIRAVVAHGAVAAVGHTSGTAADATRAFDAGATVATHLFNGMPPLHHREPGPVGAALLDERVALELILDGRHLAPATVELVHRLAGDRVVAVSDAIAATGFTDGDYDLAGTPIRVKDGVATTRDTGSLAGSTKTLDAAFAALVRRHGRSLEEAVAATSTTPARTLGLDDVGRIAPGAFADLVLLDDLAIARVMRRGHWIAAAPPVNQPDETDG